MSQETYALCSISHARAGALKAVRTYLRDLGVPGSDVDALLGHGSIGERPYAKYSCYSPMKLQRASQKAMEQLISMVGWEVHHGLIDEKSWREWHRSAMVRRVAKQGANQVQRHAAGRLSTGTERVVAFADPDCG